MDHFARFGLERKFNIDIKELKQKYLFLQIQFHPDKAVHDVKKTEFLNQSIEINEGYKILSNDLLRAIYLLSLNGIDINDEQKSAVNHGILSQALEDRELLEELHNASEIKGYLELKSTQKNRILEELGKLFDEKHYPRAQNKTIELKYHTKLIEDIKNKISKLHATS
jgi:molecular chaperone HscB